MAVLYVDRGLGGVSKVIYVESSGEECRRGLLLVDDYIYWAEAAKDGSLVAVNARHLSPSRAFWLALQIAEQRVGSYRSLHAVLGEFEARFGFSYFHLPVDGGELTQQHLLAVHAEYRSKLPVDSAPSYGRRFRLREVAKIIQEQGKTGRDQNCEQ